MDDWLLIPEWPRVDGCPITDGGYDGECKRLRWYEHTMGKKVGLDFSFHL